jgi:ribosome-associated protein
VSRKHRKGFYVDGRFVSAEDAAREELECAEPPSRTARKNAAKDLQDVGEQLLDLRPDVLAALPLPESLIDAVGEAKRIKSFGAKRRQLQLIGKLMRRLEPDALAAVTQACKSRGDS